MSEKKRVGKPKKYQSEEERLAARREISLRSYYKRKAEKGQPISKNIYLFENFQKQLDEIKEKLHQDNQEVTSR